MRITAKEANLVVDRSKCSRCGRCTHICWTHAMVKDSEGYPVMSQTDPSDTWHSCWACQRCMAVCPYRRTGDLREKAREQRSGLRRAGTRSGGSPDFEPPHLPGL